MEGDLVPRTTNDLIRRVLGLLEVVAAGQPVAAEDAELVRALAGLHHEALGPERAFGGASAGATGYNPGPVRFPAVPA